MRTLACLATLIAGLMLSGCKSPGKRPTASNDSRDPVRPAVGGNADGIAQAAARSGVNGLLAGQVLDGFNRRAANATIQVVAGTEGGEKPVPITIEANDQGYFTIPGLEPGQSYHLIARSKQGERVFAGAVWATPPDPRLLIRVSEDFVSPSTPADPVRTPYPGEDKKKQPAAPEPDAKKENKPAATIEKPVLPKAVPMEDTRPDTGAEPNPPAEGAPRRRPDLTITVPGPSVLPPTPSGRPANLPVPPAANPTSMTTVPLNAATLPVPACVMLTRHKVDNFALNDLNGQPWEFKRDRKGRVVLLDFWHTRCGPCIRAIPHLNELQQAYGAYGLEVIGIAREDCPPAERLQRLSAMRGRFNIQYRILLAGDEGQLRPCPVCTQFGIAAYPTLKLLDENGTVLWESQGLGDRQLYELRMEIEKALHFAGR